MTKTTIRLSPSAIADFKNCQYCFWMDKVKGVKKPRGIFPSLPSGMDRQFKVDFDKRRSTGHFPPGVNMPKGVKPYGDQAKLNKWREWRTTDLVYKDPKNMIVASGMVDDVTDEAGKLSPLDYKTKGSGLKGNPVEYVQNYYQHQVDIYALMLFASGYKITGHAWFIFYWPTKIDGNAADLGVLPVKVPTDLNRAKDWLERAAALIRGPKPELSHSCEWCAWISARALYQTDKL